MEHRRILTAAGRAQSTASWGIRESPPTATPSPNAAESRDHVLETLESCALIKTLRVARISDQDTDFLPRRAGPELKPRRRQGNSHLLLKRRNVRAQSVRLRLAEGGESDPRPWAPLSKIYVREQKAEGESGYSSLLGRDRWEHAEREERGPWFLHQTFCL